MLKRLDAFGYNFSVNYDKRESFGSIAGFILTIIWILLSGVVAFISLGEIVSKDKPQVYQTTLVNSSPEQLDLSGENFFFSGALETSDSKYYIDESVYTMQLEQVTAVRNKNDVYDFSSSPLSLKKCSEISSELMTEVFPDIPINHMYCYDPSEKSLMKGIFGNTLYQYVRIKIFKCNPNTSKIACKSEEEINKILHNGYFGFLVSDSTYDPASSVKPFKKFSGNYFTTVSDGVFKLLITRFNHTTSITDTGIFFSNAEKATDFAVASFEEKESVTNGPLVLQLNMRLNNKIFQFNRSYIKIQRAAADIGAVSKLLFLVFRTLIKPYQKVSYLNKALKERKWEHKEIKMKVLKFTRNLSSTSESFESKRIKPHKKSFSLGYLLFRKFKKNKFDSLKAIENKILERQDVKFFANLRNELVLLKHIVLSESQNEFVNSICLEKALKPKLLSESKSVFDEDKEIGSTFLNILRSESPLDKQFLSAFKENIGYR